MRLDVNTNAARQATRKLEQLHRSAFPNAVRGTLNKAAFDVKTNTMLRTSDAAFENRQKNFFKATSRVEKAQGWEVSNMQSKVGFQGNQQAVDDLQQQEHGGKIGSRSFIPMNTARSGNSGKKLVRPNARLSKIRSLVDARKATGRSDKEKFAKSVVHAGAGGSVLSEYQGKLILWRVNSLKRKGGRLNITGLYSFKQGRTIQVKKTEFMEKASVMTASKLENFYIQEAERQFQKALK